MVGGFLVGLVGWLVGGFLVGWLVGAGHVFCFEKSQAFKNPGPHPWDEQAYLPIHDWLICMVNTWVKYTIHRCYRFLCCHFLASLFADLFKNFHVLQSELCKFHYWS